MVTNKCWAGIIIGILVGAVVVTGIFFATGKSGSKSEKKDPHPDPPKPDPSKPRPFKDLKVFLKTKHSIMAYDLANDTYHEGASVTENPHSIISFDYSKRGTVYYATTAYRSLIQSTAQLDYPSLPTFTGEWTKTAMAVDQITGNIYVVDKGEGKIHIVDVLGEHHKEVTNELVEPFDILVDPYTNTLYILTETSILLATMSGQVTKGLIDGKNLSAMALDFIKKTLYYGLENGLFMYNFATKTTHTFQYDVISIAVEKDKLLFIDRDGVFHNCIINDTQLINCQERSTPKESEPFVSVKAYGSISLGSLDNPCGENNGGCEHLCIPYVSRENYVCACNDGWKLRGNRKSCTKH